MEQKNDNKWIEEAFKEATSKIDGKTVEEFAAHMEKTFKEEFPHTMAAFTLSFGAEKAAKMAALFFADHDIFVLAKCFFAGGYKVRMDEEGKEGMA